MWVILITTYGGLQCEDLLIPGNWYLAMETREVGRVYQPISQDINISEQELNDKFGMNRSSFSGIVDTLSLMHYLTAISRRAGAGNLDVRIESPELSGQPDVGYFLQSAEPSTIHLSRKNSMDRYMELERRLYSVMSAFAGNPMHGGIRRTGQMYSINDDFPNIDMSVRHATDEIKLQLPIDTKHFLDSEARRSLREHFTLLRTINANPEMLRDADGNLTTFIIEFPWAVNVAEKAIFPALREYVKKSETLPEFLYAEKISYKP